MRLEAVGESRAARTRRRVGAAAAVVDDLEHELAVRRTALILTCVASACLTAFGERLAGEEVAGRLDLGRQALVEAALDPDVERRARRERLERPGSPSSVRIAGWTPRASSRSSETATCSSSTAAGEHALDIRVDVAAEAALGRAQLERERDEPLLGAVVDVPLDPAALLVAGGDDARARLLAPGRAAPAPGRAGARSRA